MWVDAIVTIISAFLGALAALWGAYYSAEKFVGRPKSADSALKFSEMFHDLRQQQGRLNREYIIHQSNNTLDRHCNQEIAEEWWHRFFDLMLMQYIFFHEKLIPKEIFAQWMVWRHHEFSANSKTLKSTCGISYAEGWNYWTELPGNRESALTPFMEAVHAQPDAEHVRRMIKNWRF